MLLFAGVLCICVALIVKSDVGKAAVRFVQRLSGPADSPCMQLLKPLLLHLVADNSDALRIAPCEFTEACEREKQVLKAVEGKGLGGHAELVKPGARA